MNDSRRNPVRLLPAVWLFAATCAGLASAAEVHAESVRQRATIEVAYVEQTAEIARADGPFETVGTIRTWMSGDRVRVDAGGQTQLYDSAAGRFVSARNAERAFWSATREDLVAVDAVPPAVAFLLTVDPEDGGPSVPVPVLRRAGDAARIGSWTATPWETTAPDFEGGRNRYWLAEKAPLAWTALLRPVRALFTAQDSRLAVLFEQLDGIPGFPVRVEHETADVRLRLTVTRIETVEVSPTKFDVPADYRQVRSPYGQ